MLDRLIVYWGAMMKSVLLLLLSVSNLGWLAASQSLDNALQEDDQCQDWLYLWRVTALKGKGASRYHLVYLGFGFISTSKIVSLHMTNTIYWRIKWCHDVMSVMMKQAPFGVDNWHSTIWSSGFVILIFLFPRSWLQIRYTSHHGFTWIGWLDESFHIFSQVFFK